MPDHICMLNTRHTLLVKCHQAPCHFISLHQKIEQTLDFSQYKTSKVKIKAQKENKQNTKMQTQKNSVHCTIYCNRELQELNLEKSKSLPETNSTCCFSSQNFFNQTENVNALHKSCIQFMYRSAQEVSFPLQCSTIYSKVHIRNICLSVEVYAGLKGSLQAKQEKIKLNPSSMLTGETEEIPLLAIVFRQPWHQQPPEQQND